MLHKFQESLSLITLKEDLDTVEPGDFKIDFSNRNNAIEKGNGLRATEKDNMESKVDDKHSDDFLIENGRTLLEPEGWSNTDDYSQKEPKNNRIRPAGNYVSSKYELRCTINPPQCLQYK